MTRKTWGGIAGFSSAVPLPKPDAERPADDAAVLSQEAGPIVQLAAAPMPDRGLPFVSGMVAIDPRSRQLSTSNCGKADRSR